MTAKELRKMLLEAQVLNLVPFSRTTLWRLEQAGKFPRGTFIAPNKKVWFEDQIIDWQNTVNEFQPNRGRGRSPARQALLEQPAKIS